MDCCSVKAVKEKDLEMGFVRVIKSDKFDGDLLRRLVEKVKVLSMVVLRMIWRVVSSKKFSFTCNFEPL